MASCFASCPQDHELVDLFLRPKIAGELIDACFIHDVDVYSAAPDQLVANRTAAPGTGVGDARVWYFFSPVRHCAGKRKARTVTADGREWWHSEAGQKTVKGSDNASCFQKFSYCVKTASGVVVKPGWLMVEYSIDSQEHHCGADLVLCKVYRSPRKSRSGSSSSASSTTTVAMSLSGSGCKRKAAGDHPEAPPTARRQMDEENDLLFAEDIERALIGSSGEINDSAASMYYETHMPGGEPAVPPRAQGAETYNYHSEAPPCCVQQQTDEEGIECFKFSDNPMPVPDDVDVLPSAEDSESYMQGGEPAELQCSPGFVTEDYAVFGSEQLAGHCSGTDGGKIVFFDAGVTVGGLLEPALGECNSGLPCPASAPPCGDELLSASGDTTYTSSGGGVELCSASGNMARPAYDVTDGGRYQLLSAYLPPSRDDDDDDASLWSENVGTSPFFASSHDVFWYTPNGFWMY